MRMQTLLRAIATTESGNCLPDMPPTENPLLVPAILSICAVALLIAVFTFDHDFSKQETHCNLHVCLDLISISQVSVGVLSIGNPFSFGVISISSFVAVGVLPM